MRKEISTILINYLFKLFTYYNIFYKYQKYTSTNETPLQQKNYYPNIVNSSSF